MELVFNFWTAIISILQKARNPEAVSFNVQSYPSAQPKEAIKLLF